MVSAGRSPGTGVPRSSSEDAAAGARQAAAGEAPNVWIVQYKTSQGKDTLGRFTTVQIQTALKTGVLDSKAKVKKAAKDAFAPIGFYPEFEKGVEGQLIKDKAERKSAGLKSEFAKIGRQYDRRGWVRWVKGFISGTAGFMSFVIWIAVVFGGLAAVVLFRETLWNTFANFANSFQKS